MMKLKLVALAATAALVPGLALAQPPVPRVHAPPVPHMPNVPHMPHMPGQIHVPPQMHHSMPGPRGHFTHFRRFQRGAIIPSFWFGPQFTIGNWQLYGFARPFDGGRWIRYYDDAYLIDRDGRIRDSRYGMDWDRYGERWDYDDNGVPTYAGDRDYDRRHGEDEWSERWEDEDSDEGYGYEGGPPPPPRGDCRTSCTRTYVMHGPPPPPPPGYGGYRCGGCGSGYGYGYGYYGPVIVTETTVTTAPVVEERTYYETVTETARVARRKPHRVRCQCRRAAPARPGERG